VLSPSTRKRDLRWKRRAYARLPSLQRYVVIAQARPEVLAAPQTMQRQPSADMSASLELAALRAALPLSEVYCDTGSV
jgi:Uma2 family endonuclease